METFNSYYYDTKLKPVLDVAKEKINISRSREYSISHTPYFETAEINITLHDNPTAITSSMVSTGYQPVLVCPISTRDHVVEENVIQNTSASRVISYNQLDEVRSSAFVSIFAPNIVSESSKLFINILFVSDFKHLSPNAWHIRNKIRNILNRVINQREFYWMYDAVVFTDMYSSLESEEFERMYISILYDVILKYRRYFRLFHFCTNIPSRYSILRSVAGFE